MKIAMLAPVAWRTPPRHYGPWELFTSLLTEQLVSMGFNVTLFATADSITRGNLNSVIPKGYEEDRSCDAKVCESLHISNCFQKAHNFDLIHNNFDFAPLCYTPFVSTPVLTTIHGFSSPRIIPVYKRFNKNSFYVSISDSDRSDQLQYVQTVYHGIDLSCFSFEPEGKDYLLFFGRIHHDKGTREAIEIAKRCNKKLLIAGPVQESSYFEQHVLPFIDNRNVLYLGSVGATERNRLLGGALALLHPINFDEPFGLSVIEAMACGTPAIAFKRGSMAELIEHGNTGFLVNSIEEAVRSVHLVSEIDRKKCRKTAEKRFSAGRMAAQYVEIYRNIIKGRLPERVETIGQYK
ncbi:group 1 glycosyl transferase [Chitinispirillum alkaliphilum]|nr:group 1 glycosyl transferase [Chitinispirillum alkaliphilum]